MMSIEITEGLDIHLVKKIASHFDLEGTIEKIQKIGSGHIHKTFLIKSESDALLIQQVNHSVFLDLEGLQANLRTIEKHFKKYESYLINEEMSYLRLREANDQTLFNDGSNYWRAFEWIENS